MRPRLYTTAEVRRLCGTPSKSGWHGHLQRYPGLLDLRPDEYRGLGPRQSDLWLADDIDAHVAALQPHRPELNLGPYALTGAPPPAARKRSVGAKRGARSGRGR